MATYSRKPRTQLDISLLNLEKTLALQRRLLDDDQEYKRLLERLARLVTKQLAGEQEQPTLF